MFQNYIKLAFRNLLKNRLYAAINLLGLSLGLLVYFFGSLFAHYERNHDASFERADQIYVVGSTFSPAANIGISATDSVYTAFAPLIKAGIPEIEAVARTVQREFLISVGDDDYYQSMRFTDPDLARIFDFEYIEGDASAFDDPASIVLVQSLATKYFGSTPALGQVVMLDHQQALRVGAVIKDLRKDTHFNSSMVQDNKFEAAASLAVLGKTEDYDIAGNWNNLSMGDLTYLLLPEGRSAAWLQDQIDSLYEQHYDEDAKKTVAGTPVMPLLRMNTFIWDAVGMPVIASIQILGILVLLIACVNYTNLATAQAMGRVREVGLRRTMGAGRGQLLTQFLTESITLALVAMVVALMFLELLIPLFNEALDKVLEIQYLTLLPSLLLTAILVGLVSGGYPAFLITRMSPITALSESQKTGKKGRIIRSMMIGVQFTISIFMLSSVLVMYFQNQKLKDSAQIFPVDQILTLKRLNVDGIKENLDVLRAELKRLPEITEVAYSSQVPFEQSNNQFEISANEGDESTVLNANRVLIDYGFLKTYDIPLIAGRDLSRDVTLDGINLQDEDANSARPEVNVIINELTAKKLSFVSASAAVGQSFYNSPDSSESVKYNIVGVVKDQNFLGLHNQVKPFVFNIGQNRDTASLRLQTDNIPETLRAIEKTWDRVVPGYPLQTEFLSETFDQIYKVFRTLNMVMAGFAVLGFLLALIGLFGLAAFMAETRTREIGIRRVMGASVAQIVRLLIWQFSRPVIWAVLVALPLAYISAYFYLEFFSDRIGMPIGIILGAGSLSVIVAWLIVAGHATKVAKSNPINALRYE